MAEHGSTHHHPPKCPHGKSNGLLVVASGEVSEGAEDVAEEDTIITNRIAISSNKEVEIMIIIAGVEIGSRAAGRNEVIINRTGEAAAALEDTITTSTTASPRDIVEDMVMEGVAAEAGDQIITVQAVGRNRINSFGRK